MNMSTIIILAQVIFALLVALGFTIAVTLKLRSNNKRLRDILRRRHQIAIGSTMAPGEGDTDYGLNSSQSELGFIDEKAAINKYLRDCREESTLRYKNSTGSAHIHLEGDTPHVAKIAGLRSMYFMAESEAYPQRKKNDTRYWRILEKELNKIIEQLTSHIDGQPASEQDNKIELLRNRIKNLKHYEDECRQLKVQLDIAQKKVNKKELESTNTQLNNIREIHRQLTDMSQQSKNTESISKPLPEKTAQEFADSTLNALTAVSSINVKKVESSQRLDQGLQDYFKEDPNTDKDKLKGYIVDLNKELTQSEKVIRELENHIKNTKDNLDKKDSQIAVRESQMADLKQKIIDQEHAAAKSENRDVNQGNIEREYEIAISEIEEDSEPLLNVSEINENFYEKIDYIRNNSGNQKELILSLQKEIQNLKRSLEMSEGFSSEELEKKNQEISKLDRLIMESEHCIVALESEVDYLNDKLKTDLSPETTSSTVHNTSLDENLSDHNNDEELLKESTKPDSLEAELENVSAMLDDTLTLYQHQITINQYALSATTTTNLKTLLKNLIETTRSIDLEGGIQLISKQQTADYLPVHLVNKNDIKLITSNQPPNNKQVSEYDDDFLVWFPNARLYLKDAPTNMEKRRIACDNIITLLKITSSSIEKMGQTKNLATQKSMLESIVSSAKTSLTNMEIQQSYQKEEAHRIINKLASEIFKMTTEFDMPESLKTVLEMSAQESQERMALLFTSAAVIDQSFKQLIEKLDAAKHKVSKT